MSGRGGPLVWLPLLLALSCGGKDKSADAGGAANDGGTASQGANVTCANYCHRVMAACTGENAVYVNDQACLAVCALLEPGDAQEPRGNTVACRSAQAASAEREPEAYCAAAGPGGNGACGSDCEAYCALYPQACPSETEEQGTQSCLEACSALVDQPSFDLITDHQGDTLECRLVHLASATLSPAEHCHHARLAPTQPWCVPERP